MQVLLQFFNGCNVPVILQRRLTVNVMSFVNVMYPNPILRYIGKILQRRLTVNVMSLVNVRGAVHSVVQLQTTQALHPAFKLIKLFGRFVALN